MRSAIVTVPARSSARSSATKRLVGAVLLLALAASDTPRVSAQAGEGQWTTLTYLMPINPVHLTLLNNGRVLVVAGSGNVAAETNFRSTIWDPQAGTFSTRSHAWDMFCNGAVVLPDGRVLINGGNKQYDPFRGYQKNALYDPATDTFTDVENMAHGRWYPTPTVLGDGRVMTFSGLDELTGATNKKVEIYTVGSGWSPEYDADWTPPLYPRMHLISDGRVFYSGSGRGSRFFDPSTKTWSPVTAATTTKFSGTRGYGTSVLLPLSPSNGYASRVMIFGGGNPATSSTEIIDLSAATPEWQFGPSMSQGRIQLNATILPNGKVLVMGGSVNDEQAATASLNADLYDPKTNTFSSAGANVYPRLYHSGSLLLPDGTVALMGGNPTRGSYEQHIEIYSPAYLFEDGKPALRPTITSTSDTMYYGHGLQVQTPNAGQIQSVVLVRPGSQTHAFDMDQRLVELSFTKASGSLTVTAPPHGNIAPPGYYMLFILNSAGVPSLARFVRLATGTPANQAPTATIDSPSSNMTINPGGSISFAGSGSDPDGNVASYAWTFDGGSPAASTEAAPGAVTYSTPGSYSASLIVTDDDDDASVAATRTITVADFSLSGTPASRSVPPGADTTYSATVGPIDGFTGNVSFDVLGLPSGASGSFTPGSVSSAGSTTLAVSTSASTPIGTYTLTVNGTSGPITRSTTVTLIVAAVNQAPSATITSPSSNMTINPGGSISFAGSGSDPDGNVASYAWSFGGGSPAASTEAAPGAVTYSTPGSYSASLTVTDDAGTASVLATRTITVADFSLSATPASHSVLPGAGTTYTATVGAIDGFTGNVSFDVLGLPSGASASFTPASVASAGSTTLGVSTSASTPAGTYTLTIRGTSGPITRSTTVTLVVAANQAPTATITSPSSNMTINPGGFDLVRRLWLRSRRERGVVRLELRRRQSGREHSDSARSRDLLHAWQLFGFSHRDRQRRRRERSRHANDHGRRLLTLGHACVAQRPAGSGHDVHRHGGADQWIHRQRQLRRTRPPLWRQRILHACFGVERWLDDARGVDERFYPGRYLHAHHPRHERPDHEDHDRHAHCGWNLFDLRLSAEPDRTQKREHDLRGHAGSRKRVHGSRDVLDQPLAEEHHRAVLANVGHHIGNDDIAARHQEERRAGNLLVDGQRHQQRAGPLGVDHVDSPVASCRSHAGVFWVDLAPERRPRLPLPPSLKLPSSRLLRRCAAPAACSG